MILHIIYHSAKLKTKGITRSSSATEERTAEAKNYKGKQVYDDRIKEKRKKTTGRGYMKRTIV